MNPVLTGKANNDDPLSRYIINTDLIRDLSAPHVNDISSADEYRVRLMHNFTQIGEISKKNVKILKTYYEPLLLSNLRDDEQSLAYLRDFSDALFNAYNLNNLDIPIVYKQAERLLKEADLNGNVDSLIQALDNMVSAAYPMICITGRLLPMDEACFRYRDAGLSASKRLLQYLDKDRFKTLSDASKEAVLINARYIRVVSEIDDVEGDVEQNEQDLQWMMDALAIAEDPFYHEQLPEYDWNYHIFRTLEYICAFTDLNNKRKFNKEQLHTINECTKRFVAMYESNEFYYNSIHWSKNIMLFRIRNAYLDDELSLDDYKKELVRLFTELADASDEGQETKLLSLHAPLEYMLLLDKDRITEEEAHNLNVFYDHLIMYIHQTPKKNNLAFLLTCLSLILKYYIEIPGGMDFETMALRLMAALHPPTYVHSLGVAQLSECLTRHLLKRNPERFIGMPGYDSLDAVLSHADEITDYVYHAALCHDFGKIMIAETILTYGRHLLDDEFDYIKAHPGIGAYLVSCFPDTAPYMDIVHGHHKWFNDAGGYPHDFKMNVSPYKTAIALVNCADCLDAATDSVGRSYKDGKSLDQFLAELYEGRGTRYADWLPELIADPDVRADIESILATGRDKNYQKTYHILKQANI